MKLSTQRPPTTREFCDYLRAEREQRALSLAEISRITKVPRPSLERLEAGEFEKLPAEVFVCGFLRSYARCVGLDPEDVVRRYRDARAIKPTVFEVAPAAADDDVDEDDAADDDVVAAPVPASSRSRLHATGSFIYGQLFEDREAGSRRGAVTLAVIILVIVATLTMSYLLRRPSSSGDGVTTIESVQQDQRLA